MTTVWSELVSAALVGTARAPALPAVAGSPALEALLAHLPEMPQPPDPSPERVLLVAAGTVALWRQAGLEPPPASLEPPSPPPPAEECPCPPRAEEHLARILTGDLEVVLPEWLDALHGAGGTLPARWLPEVLDRARRNPDLCPSVMPVLGARGRWLAAQNPEWRALFAAADPAAQDEVWEHGDLDARLALLRSLRGRLVRESPAPGPARARELVAGVWRQERAPVRTALLETFAVGLSPEDEPFLEDALDDRSKYVRAVAADLLARLPGSALVRRSTLRARLLLRPRRAPSGERSLDVTLPETCDEAMRRDGVVEKPPRGTGPRAWWLQQMFAAVPPSYWSEGWSMAPAELIELASATDEATALLAGWTQAAARFRDAAWSGALLRRWSESQDWPILGSLPGLYAALPPETLDPWLATRLRSFMQTGRKAPAADHQTILDVLRAYPYPWSPDLTRAFLDICRDQLRAAASSHNQAWRWMTLLEEVALRASPYLEDFGDPNWSEKYQRWQAQATRFIETLRFRREMLERLNVPT